MLELLLALGLGYAGYRWYQKRTAGPAPPTPEVPPPPPPPGAPPLRGSPSPTKGVTAADLDAGIPPPVVAHFLNVLATEKDPAQLDAVAASLQSRFPKLAALVAAQAAWRRAQPASFKDLNPATRNALLGLAPKNPHLFHLFPPGFQFPDPVIVSALKNENLTPSQRAFWKAQAENSPYFAQYRAGGRAPAWYQ